MLVKLQVVVAEEYTGDMFEIQSFEKLTELPKECSEILPNLSPAGISDFDFANWEEGITNNNSKYLIGGLSGRFWKLKDGNFVVDLTEDEYGKFVFIATKLERKAVLSVD